jgi:hypothetical protein
MIEKIIIEGSDLVGKSTIVDNLLALNLNVKDRDKNICNEVILDIERKNIENIKKYIENHNNWLFVFFYFDNNDKKLIEYMDKLPKIDKYDELYKEYNKIYKLIIDHIQSYDNVLIIKRTTKQTPYKVIQKILKKYVENIDYKTLPITIEREHKTYKRLPNTDIAFVILKNQNSNNIPNTILRNNIWTLLGSKLNKTYSDFVYKKIPNPTKIMDYYATELNKFKNNIFVSNFLLKINDTASLVIFRDNIPNIEISWKKNHFENSKQKFFDLEKFKTRTGEKISENVEYPIPIINFNWKNSITTNEKNEIIDLFNECIADDFADFYIDTNHSKILTYYSGWWLYEIFKSIDIEMYGINFLQNENGDTIHSELSPAEMKLKFDNKSKNTYIDWEQLYKKLIER